MSKPDGPVQQEGKHAGWKVEMSHQVASGSFSLLFLDNYTNVYENIQNIAVRIDPGAGNDDDALLVNCHFDSPVGSPDGPVQQKGKHAGWKVEMSHQVASGSFSLLFLDNYTNVYENIQNIAVRIDPGVDNDDDALLVNCHFDSPVGSPGASDDAVNCATMLEVLRGAHAFITQHPWRKQAKILINLEAAGSGGREILFQAGPRASWLVEIYKQATSFPVSSGFWQDIFDTGAIPSDTDFRIFRDYGGMSGLDIAFVKNGYVYHTEYDEEKRIPAETVQRIGENLHKLILALGSADWPRDNADSLRVHFDFAGLYLLTYGSTVRHLLTLLAFLATAFLMKNHAISGHRRLSVYAKQVVVSTTAVLLSWACGAIANVCVAGLMASLHTTMAYYGSMSWIVPLYVVPAWGAMSACQRLVSEWQAGKHFGRSYHTIDAGSNDTLEKQDSGFWTPVLDWNTPTALYEAVPQMRRAERSNLKEDHCQKRLWCHAPYLIPAINLAPTSVIVHAPPPTIKVRMKMQHFREIHEQRNIKTINYTTSLTNGPDHIAIVVSPTSGWKIARWSFHETVTASLADPLNGQPNYYVFYSHGLPPTTPLVFWIQIQQTGEENQGSEDVKLEMLIISSYQHGAPLNDAKFQEYRRQFPDWALTIPSAATIDVIRRH
ncbi:unnamed protein product [Notodromas monacha]|uniref:FXNA-like protease n=1 Tax=Notodromas monacha TaxID=399045 RepID=A0A7R9BH35_9CRUS|nr:unnamed protein product [Notodromas monacha]CAG0915360.1 unnamed protein product [Notodromas monacha]